MASAESATPARLVEKGRRRYGRLAARPTTVNPNDEFMGLTRALRTWRLKEWVGFTLFHPDWYSSQIMQEAQYLASSEIYAYNRATRALYQHAANLTGGMFGGSLHLPTDLFGGHCEFARPGYRMTYDFASDNTQHILRYDIAATSTAPALTGELVLDAAHASPPLSVSSRLPGGKMYTHKAIFPVEGVLHVGDQDIVFDKSRDLAILDEHKSFLPYRTRWVWGTFALPTSDGLVGANFADRPEKPGEPEESCLWTPDACEPLADITFTPRKPGDPLAPWQITSKDGRLDVVFEPEGRKGVRQNLVLFAIDYFQMYGQYRGTVRGANKTYDINGVHGVCEVMRARL